MSRSFGFSHFGVSAAAAALDLMSHPPTETATVRKVGRAILCAPRLGKTAGACPSAARRGLRALPA
jgi:hypothetical protein